MDLPMVLEGVVALLAGILGGYFSGVFNGALYVPARADEVDRILKLAALQEGERLVDLGSGDGRIVVAAARVGFESVGYEINPILVWISRRSLRKEGLSGTAHIESKDFWNQDLSGFQAVVIFGVPRIMKRLERKLERELLPGSKVISVVFPLPGWSGERHGSLYLYKR